MCALNDKDKLIYFMDKHTKFGVYNICPPLVKNSDTKIVSEFLITYFFSKSNFIIKKYLCYIISSKNNFYILLIMFKEK